VSEKLPLLGYTEKAAEAITANTSVAPEKAEAIKAKTSVAPEKAESIAAKTVAAEKAEAIAAKTVAAEKAEAIAAKTSVSAEISDAYVRAYDKKITTAPTIQEANPQ